MSNIIFRTRKKNNCVPTCRSLRLGFRPRIVKVIEVTASVCRI
jgi:hypothetical protein